MVRRRSDSAADREMDAGSATTEGVASEMAAVSP